MRRLLMLALIGTLPSLHAASASAQRPGRWRQVGTTSAGNPVFLDPSSVVRKDSLITAALRVTFAPPMKHPKGDVRSNLVTATFDCAKGQVAVKESTFYADLAMTTVVERRAPKQPGFGPVFRSNFSGVALAHLCAPPQAPAKAPPGRQH